MAIPNIAPKERPEVRPEQAALAEQARLMAEKVLMAEQAINAGDTKDQEVPDIGENPLSDIEVDDAIDEVFAGFA